MSYARNELIQVFKNQCFKKDEVVPKYRDELFNVVSEIIYNESINMERKSSIQQDVSALCGRLGTFIENNFTSQE